MHRLPIGCEAASAGARQCDGPCDAADRSGDVARARACVPRGFRFRGTRRGGETVERNRETERASVATRRRAIANVRSECEEDEWLDVGLWCVQPTIHEAMGLGSAGSGETEARLCPYRWRMQHARVGSLAGRDGERIGRSSAAPACFATASAAADCRVFGGSHKRTIRRHPRHATGRLLATHERSPATPDVRRVSHPAGAEAIHLLPCFLRHPTPSPDGARLQTRARGDAVRSPFPPGHPGGRRGPPPSPSWWPSCRRRSARRGFSTARRRWYLC
eukprot:ctg_750.g202